MVEFDFDIVKECLFFGVKMGFPGLFSASTQIVTLSLMIIFVPQYATFTALAGMAFSLVATSDRLVYQNFTPLYAEAYQSDKKKLCQYYNAHALRFFAVNTGFSFSIMLTVITVFERVFMGLGLERYLLTIPFLIPALIQRGSRPYERYPGNILVAAHKPNELLILNITMEALKIGVLYFTIAVLKIQNLGIIGVVYVLTLGDYPVKLLQFFISMLYIDKKIFKIKIMPWQTFAAPIFSTSILLGVFYFLKVTVLDRLWEWSFIGTILIGLIALIILVLVFYFPLTMLLGGWDENSVRDLRRAVKMSGASKILIKPTTTILFKLIPYSKLYNKFKFDESAAYKELNELIEIRNENREKFKAETLKKEN